MGVPGLWDIINKAGQSRSLAHLAVVDGFETNHSGSRTLRIGIDASIWLRHAIASVGPHGADRGVNAAQRTLFWRLARFSKLPFSVLFVFDGRERPKVKRGSRMGKSGTHNLAREFRELVDMFGMDAREARGEAEAELAYLNRSGAIDAIVSDDVDTLIFGARMVLKNVSLSLTGNKSNPAKNANGKNSVHHTNVYTAQEIASHPDVQLTRGGLVLFALMSGGDYGTGITGCGQMMAHAMARLGFGDRLLEAYLCHGRSSTQGGLRAFLYDWRADLQVELRTNAHGFMSRAAPNLVVPQDFPPLEVLGMYADPLTSETDGGTGGGPPRERRPVDVAGIAGFFERKFTDWGPRKKIVMTFRRNVVEGLVMTILKTAAREADRKEEERMIEQGIPPGEVRVRGVLQPDPEDGVGTPATLVKQCLKPVSRRRAERSERDARIAAAFVNRGAPEPEEERSGGIEDAVEDTYPLIVGITMTRKHVSTDCLLEYRVEIHPRQIIEFINAGLKGSSGSKGGTRGRRRDRRYEDTDSEDERADNAGDHDEDTGVNSEDPNAKIMLWIPASIMRQVHPRLVEEYEAGKRNKKTPKKKTTAVVQPQGEAGGTQSATTPSGRTKGKGRARAEAEDSNNAEHDDYDYLSANPFASSALPKEYVDVMAHSTFPIRDRGFFFTWPDPDDPDRLIVDTTEREDLPTSVDYRAVERAGGPVYREYGDGPGNGNAVGSDRAPAAAASVSAAGRKRKGKGKETEVGAGGGGGTALAKKGKRAQRHAEDDADEPLVDPEGGGRFSRHNDEIDALLTMRPRGSSSRKGKQQQSRRAEAASGNPRAPASAFAAGGPSSGSSSRGTERAEPGPSRPTKRRKTTHGGEGAGTLLHASESGSQPQERRRSFSTFDISAYEDSSDSSRSPSPRSWLWNRSSSPAAPPPSSAAPTPSTCRSARLDMHTPGTSRSRSIPSSPCVRTRTVPVDDDVISLSSDSSDDAPGKDGRDGDDGWLNDVSFNGRRSVYGFSKASEPQRSLAAAIADSGDVMDEDDYPCPGSSFPLGSSLNGNAEARVDDGQKLKSARRASAAAASLYAKRSYRDPPIPSSSQESTLDDGSDDFFRGTSVVINLS